MLGRCDRVYVVVLDSATRPDRPANVSVDRTPFEELPLLEFLGSLCSQFHFSVVPHKAAPESLRDVAATQGVDPLAYFSGPTRYEDLQVALNEISPDGLRYYWKSIYLEELNWEVIRLVNRYNETASSALSTVDIWWLGGGSPRSHRTKRRSGTAISRSW